MKKVYIFITLHIMLIINLEGFGQPKIIMPLKIGDRAPDIILGEILNHPNLKTAKLSDFKGKLLILDFWGSFCGPCIAEMPKMANLQQQFKDEITILPIAVDGESSRKLVNSWQGTTKEMKLPTVLIDDIKIAKLIKYVPPTSLPHEVWIDKDGVVIAITGAEAVNSSNIKNVLKNQSLPFREKKRKFNFSMAKNLLIGEKLAGSIYGAAFSGYNDTLMVTSNSLKDSSKMHLLHINETKLSLYRRAYMASRLLPLKSSEKLIVYNDMRNPLSLERRNYELMDNWQRDNFNDTSVYCYELVLPCSYSKENAYLWMISDLDKFFRMDSHVKRVNVKCLSLIKTSSIDKIRSELSQNSGRNVENDLKKEAIIYSNCSVSFLIEQLNSKFRLDNLIINGTDYHDKIDVELPEKLTSINQLRNALKKYDLDLVEVEHELPVLVLNDKK